MIIRRLASLLALAACIPTTASAGFFDDWGYSPRAVAQGGALTANATDFSAVFYNPAMLVLRKDVNFGFGIDYARTDMTVQPKTLDRELDCAYCDPNDWVGEDIGLLFPLGGKVQNHLALGVGLHLPSARLLSVRAPDPDRPFWYGWNNEPDRIVVLLGAGIRILDQLSIGIGTQALADLTGDGAKVTVDLFSKEVKFREINSHLATTFGPVASVYVTPLPNLRFGASWRSEMRVRYSIPADITMEGVGQLKMTIEGYNHYTPHTFTLGTSWDVTPQVTLSMDAAYQRWSAAPSPYVHVAVDMGGATLEALGLGEALDLDSSDRCADEACSPGFKDTVVPRFGVEYRLTERFTARAGAWFRPTFVPDQNQFHTNILDSDTLGVSGGIGWSFDDPLEVFQAPILIDLAVHGLWLLPREAEKDPTDYVPSYSFSGRVVGVSAMVRYNF
ncbi:MAG: outer membrane protein transport protein [Myxococcaceae bacterium]|nr:outer membrane protein transport protein [Myxococcaceae bacterium]